MSKKRRNWHVKTRKDKGAGLKHVKCEVWEASESRKVKYKGVKYQETEKQSDRRADEWKSRQRDWEIWKKKDWPGWKSERRWVTEAEKKGQRKQSGGADFCNQCLDDSTVAADRRTENEQMAEKSRMIEADPEQLQRIFEEFYREDSSRNQKEGKLWLIVFSSAFSRICKSDGNSGENRNCGNWFQPGNGDSDQCGTRDGMADGICVRKRITDSKYRQEGTSFILLSGLATGASWLCYYRHFRKDRPVWWFRSTSWVSLWRFYFPGLYFMKSWRRKRCWGLWESWQGPFWWQWSDRWKQEMFKNYLEKNLWFV